MSSKLIHLNTNDSKLGRNRMAEGKKNYVMRANIDCSRTYSCCRTNLHWIARFMATSTRAGESYDDHMRCFTNTKKCQHAGCSYRQKSNLCIILTTGLAKALCCLNALDRNLQSK